MADTDPAVELVARAIREATDTELDDCLEDEDECFERKIHLGSQIEGVVRTVYATPEQIGRVSVAALTEAGRLLPPVVQTREEWGVVSRTGAWYTYRTQAQAEDSLRAYRASWTRLGSSWPDVHVRVRTITTHTDGSERIGAWREVES